MQRGIFRVKVAAHYKVEGLHDVSYETRVHIGAT